MTMDELQFWTLLIAMGGLATGMVSLFWNIFLHVLSGPKIKVTATIVQMFPTPTGLPDHAEVLLLEAVNLRSRPVTITQFWGKACKPEKDGQPYFFIRGSSPELAACASTLPLQLKEGDVARLMRLAKPIELLLNAKYFFATDTTGKKWRSRKHPLRGELEGRPKHRLVGVPGIPK